MGTLIIRGGLFWFFFGHAKKKWGLGQSPIITHNNNYGSSGKYVDGSIRIPSPLMGEG
jgi:hypothetical protein